MWLAENIFVIGICKNLYNADDLKKSFRYPSNGSFTVIRLPPGLGKQEFRRRDFCSRLLAAEGEGGGGL
jgi:hypothetical protein